MAEQVPRELWSDGRVMVLPGLGRDRMPWGWSSYLCPEVAISQILAQAHDPSTKQHSGGNWSPITVALGTARYVWFEHPSRLHMMSYEFRTTPRRIGCPPHPTPTSV
jgi:hypothetical protein